MKMNNLMVVLSAVLALGVCGCSKSESPCEDDLVEETGTDVEAFDIPLTLYERMMVAADEARNKVLPIEGDFDDCELLGLGASDLASNAVEIVKRPRGEMQFVDDLCSEEERRKIWPFEVEAFEATLEAKMKLGEQGYQLIGENGELEPRNPTIRWFNAEMDAWAVKQLDSTFPRVSEAEYCKVTGDESLPEGVDAWSVDEVYTLILDRSREGAWCPRDYIFVYHNEERSAESWIVATFESFPNAKEALAVLGSDCMIASIHNLAVLEWRHRIFRYQMSPYRIESYLKRSKRGEVPTADANLNVLYAHIPELLEAEDKRKTK